MKTVKFLKDFKGLGLSTKKGDTKDVHAFHANVLVKKGFAEIQEKELKETHKTKEEKFLEKPLATKPKKKIKL